jgi:hypothetical protein
VYIYHENCILKGIVSRDFVVCFLVSFDRSEVSTHKEWVHLLLKFRFRVEFRVQIFVEICGKVEMKLATYNICVASTDISQYRLLFGSSLLYKSVFHLNCLTAQLSYEGRAVVERGKYSSISKFPHHSINGGAVDDT